MDEVGERGKGSKILRLTEGREIKKAPREQRIKTLQLVTVKRVMASFVYYVFSVISSSLSPSSSILDCLQLYSFLFHPPLYTALLLSISGLLLLLTTCPYLASLHPPLSLYLTSTLTTHLRVTTPSSSCPTTTLPSPPPLPPTLPPSRPPSPRKTMTTTKEGEGGKAKGRRSSSSWVESAEGVGGRGE